MQLKTYRFATRRTLTPTRASHKLFLSILALIILAGYCFSTPFKDSAAQIDSGAFAVIINGKRAATETFSIQQDAAGSVIKSEFKAEQGEAASEQTSEMDITANGELRKYSWKEIHPGSAHFTVAPTNEFLMERYAANSQEKEAEQPFLLPNATIMLDDYSFVQREVLAWKYLATGCHQDKGQLSCPLHQKVMFGSLNPHARSSAPVNVEFAGREKVTIRGTERELIRLNIISDSGTWALWLDDQFKLQRIVVPGENIEVLRD